MLSPARKTAFQVLEQVTAGAYASDLLLEMSRPLDSRDAGLASEIVFGVLRHQSQLDYLVRKYSGRPTDGQNDSILIALRAAIYQIRYLDRIPPHAAVDDSVEFVKTRQKKAAGFVNAVLRKVNRSPVRWPDEATELSCPKWLLERWKVHFGDDAGRAIAAEFLKEPQKYVREYETGPRFQDIGSQAIPPLLRVGPEHSFLDLCAAPGNKTLQIVTECRPKFAVASDISERRLRMVPVGSRVVLDAAKLLPFSGKFDRILLDAPCSGTGTIGRNPEIKWRLKPEDFTRFHAKQVEILRSAIQYVAPGGTLVYATCSLEPEENRQVIAQAGLQPESELIRLPGRDEGDGFYAARLLPPTWSA